MNKRSNIDEARVSTEPECPCHDDSFAIIRPFGGTGKIFSIIGAIPPNNERTFLTLEAFRWDLLAADQEEGPFVFIFNSPGGNGFTMFFLLDILSMLYSSIYTVACSAQSAATILFSAAGTPGQRFIYPNATLLLHNGKIPFPYAEDKHYLDEYVNPRMARLLDGRCNVNAILARRSTVEYPPSDNEAERIKSFVHLLDNDQYFTAQEAIEFGLADYVMDKETEHRLLFPPSVKPARRRRAFAAPRAGAAEQSLYFIAGKA